MTTLGEVTTPGPRQSPARAGGTRPPLPRARTATAPAWPPPGADGDDGAEATVRGVSGFRAYCAELVALAAIDGRVVCLAGLPGRVEHPFEQAHPERFFALRGVASAMIEVVRGLVAAGFRPFVCTGPGLVPAALRASYLSAGAHVVAPGSGLLAQEPLLRGLDGVTLAEPCGATETRAVIRAAVGADRPYHIGVGGTPRPYWPRPDLTPGGPPPAPLAWESTGANEDEVCLVSIGEYGTGVARAARAVAPWLAHAHLVYRDATHLKAAAGELALRRGGFVVTGVRPAPGGVADALAALLPGHPVITGTGSALGTAAAEVESTLGAAHALTDPA
ncbi:transketolase [Streptomyces sp. NPDC091377]|uniref:transketolase n=1 Tax=unclassified Streptomyces TaxID=2593676 RepID=UPI00382998B0